MFILFGKLIGIRYIYIQNDNNNRNDGHLRDMFQ